MIEIDIQEGTYHIFYSKLPISVSRIGDVAILFKDKEVHQYQARPPWKALCSSEKIESRGNSDTDIIKFEAIKFNLDTIVKIFKEKELNLAVLQEGFQTSLCILKGNFCGHSMSIGSSIFNFNVNKSEMIYN
jgi:hypothetical protein